MATTTKNATPAEVYRKAASYMESFPNGEYAEYSCVAICHVANVSNVGGQPLATRYAEVFGTGLPAYVDPGESVETSLQGGFSKLTNGERQDARILALCFMAAMVEAGDA